MGALSKFLAGLGVNLGVIGVPAIGWGGLLFSKNAGGYMDPYAAQGYRYNPGDGRWYQTPPDPDHGQFGWEGPADSATQQELEIVRQMKESHNRIEHLSPGQGESEGEGFVGEALGRLWKQARNWIPPRRDPLVLDMDGDGIETVGTTGAASRLLKFVDPNRTGPQ